ncbi:Nn.00g110100.m01.CDS01 [Neocucurbitaria sp. VM-36]
MQIPKISLNSTFAVPALQPHQEKEDHPPSSHIMCKYTIYSYECGHAAEDNVDSRNCSEYQRMGIHCDRDNPANRNRVQVMNKERNGICDKCLYKESRAADGDEMNEMQRAREESLAEAERREAEHEAQIKELERESAEEYEQKMRRQEEEDLEFMLKQSKLEAERAAHRQEMEMVEQAFRESLKVDPAGRNYNDEVVASGSKDLGCGSVEKRVEITRTSRELFTETSAPIPPPPGPPPPLRVASTPKALENPIPKTLDYSLPAVGDQHIGRFTVGTRHMPIHPSQEIKQPTTPNTPVTPISLSPIARLGGTIAPNIPAMREIRGPGFQIPSPHEARAGLRNTGGPRSPLAPREEAYVDPKLKAAMAKRRQWEEETDDTASNVSSMLITPSQSASDISMRSSAPAGSLIGGASTTHAESAASEATGAAEEAWGDDDVKTMRAKRISKFEFDKNRRTGWGGE